MSSRAHAEEVLADRALNGVEETVFYHGEEVATRTRYDARLLLAHLARLDAKAEDPVAAVEMGAAAGSLVATGLGSDAGLTDRDGLDAFMGTATKGATARVPG